MRSNMKIKKKIVCSMLLAILCLTGCNSANSKVGGSKATENANAEYTQDVFAMDTYMSLTAYGAGAKKSVEDAVTEINRLDALWSVGNKDGEVATLNKEGSGILSKDTKELFCRSLDLYKSTKGAFDITVYPLMDLWGFTTGKYHVPSKAQLKETLKYVNQSKIEFSEEDGAITLGEGQKVDFGGIAKGFTSNRIMEIWKEQGITSGMVSLGGNVQVLGSKTDGSAWKIGIQNPDNQDGEMIGVVTVKNKAVITSGGYERYFKENGKKYHHILDTKNGYPADSGLTSVSIVSEDGTLADGLSTSLFVMGKDKAIAYWRQHKDEFDTILVENDGSIYVTEGLEKCFSSDYKFEIVRGDAQ